MMPYILDLSQIEMKSLRAVGRNSATLGEIFNHIQSEEVGVPLSFSITTSAYDHFLSENELGPQLEEILASLDACEFSNLAEVGLKARSVILGAHWPDELRSEIYDAYTKLLSRCAPSTLVSAQGAVISEFRGNASFSVRKERVQNISGSEQLLEACRQVLTVCFTDQAIRHRVETGCDHALVRATVNVQQMIRDDLACSGIVFTSEPKTMDPERVVLYGMPGTWEARGEEVYAIADRYVLIKREVKSGLASKFHLAGLRTGMHANLPALDLSDAEVASLTLFCVRIEEHFGRAMEVRWSKDGITGELFIHKATFQIAR